MYFNHWLATNIKDLFSIPINNNKQPSSAVIKKIRKKLIRINQPLILWSANRWRVLTIVLTGRIGWVTGVRRSDFSPLDQRWRRLTNFWNNGQLILWVLHQEIVSYYTVLFSFFSWICAWQRWQIAVRA